MWRLHLSEAEMCEKEDRKKNIIGMRNVERNVERNGKEEKKRKVEKEWVVTRESEIQMAKCKVKHHGRRPCTTALRPSYPCLLCPKLFDMRLKRADHLILSHYRADGLVRCDSCGRGFTRVDGVLEHRWGCQEYQRSRGIDKPRPQHECEVCGKRYMSPKYLRRHITLAHQKVSLSNFYCDICDKYFTLLSSLQQHHKKKHSATAAPPRTRAEMKRCPTCRRFVRDPLSCNRCDRPKQMPECLICGKMFSKMFNLNRHLLSHLARNGRRIKREAASRPVCLVCNRSYYDKTTLNKHLMLHVKGEKGKKYGCEQCGERFRGIGALKQHMVVHTGVKPYGCQKCGERFSWAWQVALHKRLCYKVM